MGIFRKRIESCYKGETRINYLRVVYGLSDVHDVDNVLDRKNDNG